MNPQTARMIIRITMSLGLLFAVTAVIICIAALVGRPIKSMDWLATPCLALALCSSVVTIALSSMLRKSANEGESRPRS